jgi:arylsulfatase A
MRRMKRRDFLKAAGSAALAPALAGGVAGGIIGASACRPVRRSFGTPFTGKPNIVLILADDLGLTDPGCYGGMRIRTPNIDRLAAEGLRFTQGYAGSPVCAPSRCVLLTGLHTGHAWIRDNHEIEPEGQEPLPAGTVTLPGLLRQEGYTTAAIGKWGLGYPGSAGEPNQQGFDLFYGYNCQRKAHNHYPAYLWHNGEKVFLEGNNDGLSGRQYAPDLFEAKALEFIRSWRQGPFFLYFATTVPHLALQVPEDSLAEYRGLWLETPYDGKKGYLPQAEPRAAYAAMVTRFDRSVGRILALLKELGIDRTTLVLFASDNGSTYDVGGFDMEFFQGTDGLRAHKGYVYEGGIRIPLIARWPGRIAAGRTSDHVCAFQDVMPTLLEAAGAPGRVPGGIDGLSFWPALAGTGVQPRHASLYMEFPDYGGQQAVRLGKWKAVRSNLRKDPKAAVELYDLAADPAESRDVAAGHADLVARITEIMRAERRPSPVFPFPALDGGPGGGVTE